MKEQKQNKIISALLTTALGLIFLIWKDGVIGVAMTVLGALLVIQAVLHLIHKNYTSAIIKAVIGILVIVFGWALASAALFVMSAVWLIYGVMQLIDALKIMKNVKKTAAKVVLLIQPVIDILIAGSLLFNQSGTVAWAFILAGVFLIIQGVLALADALFTK